jgi:histidine ammonia-lyase
MITTHLDLFNVELSQSYWMNLSDFHTCLNKPTQFFVNQEAIDRLDETRSFIDYLLQKEYSVYGLTTGFGDLRNTSISADEAGLLSLNLIRSHDAGIGKPLSKEITLGAMILRAHSLSKGHSGFSKESLTVLLQMINARIIPEVPSTGSLGASGDLAFLARIGRAMAGEDVPVDYQGQKMSASDALRLESISCFEPKAKEGLALTNGTSFMASMLAIAYLEELQCLENLIALTGVFLNSVQAIDAAFYESIHNVRYQKGQILVARLLRPFFENSTLIDRYEVQNDYCIRCLPQIYGPKFELILEQRKRIEQELNAITDNPLIFKNSEITSDVLANRIIPFDNNKWAVLSGGNFHGENLTSYADTIAIANAKIALTIERQLTYLLNPFRNKQKLPIYLIPDENKIGLKSGLMITQYTANGLTHKICLLAQPSSTMNLTSANESEDIVSYGATACQKLLKQIVYFKELLAIYLVTCAQAYSLAKKDSSIQNPLVEQIFSEIQEKMLFPITEDTSFDQKYRIAFDLLESGVFSKIIGAPLQIEEP